MRNAKLRVLSVMPGLPIGWRMIFIRNDIAAIEKLGVTGRSFYLASRTSPPILLREAYRFQEEINAFRPDLVHVHYGTVSALFCVAMTRLPIVVTYQGSDLNPCTSMNFIRSVTGRFLSQLAALRADRIICVSRELKDKLWWNQGRAHVLPSGVDTTFFYPVPRGEARTQLGWDDDERVVVSSAGTDPRRKRLDLAKAAVKIAESRCGAIRLIVLDGTTEHKELPILLSAADCLLMTSDWEGSPNIVKEAMACDLPVISVDVGDVKERLKDVEPSPIVSRDPTQLGAALEQLLQRRPRSNGHERIQELTAPKFAERVLSIYDEVLHG